MPVFSTKGINLKNIESKSEKEIDTTMKIHLTSCLMDMMVAHKINEFGHDIYDDWR